jgi:AcrR family transcriptional regulator
MSTTSGTRSQPGRKPQISREQIVAAALRGNLDTLTMRELATRLGVTHGALYRWVSSSDDLFDLISEVMVDRILPAGRPDGTAWRPWLARLAWAMHDEFLAVPGYATRVARPHRHNPESFGRLRAAVTGAFAVAGTGPELAEQSWYIFGTSIVSWLAATEAPLGLGAAEPRFDLFLDSLLRGLPAREPGLTRPLWFELDADGVEAVVVDVLDRVRALRVQPVHPGARPRLGALRRFETQLVALVVPGPGVLVDDHHAQRAVGVLGFAHSRLDDDLKHSHLVVVQQDPMRIRRGDDRVHRIRPGPRLGHRFSSAGFPLFD